jgi:dipicolinate synthase subunit B
LEPLKAEVKSLQFVVSYHVAQLNNRFSSPPETFARLRELSDKSIITSIPDAEPLGPKNQLDLFCIAPCTGNTLAKLANGITDTPVLMAAKGHLRNNKPLVIALATNDALSNNFRNIGTLLATKNIYFVPLGQDLPDKKPNSLVAHLDLLKPTIEAALRGMQLEPLLVPFQNA